MKKTLLLVVALSCATIARADEWTTSDKALLAGAVGLLAIDWGQTHDLARRNQTYYLTPACSDPETRSHPLAGACPPQSVRPYHEVNPLLPSQPSSGDVDRYFAVAMLGTAGLAYALPPQYRRPFLTGVIVIEALIVAHNQQLGLRLSF